MIKYLLRFLLVVCLVLPLSNCSEVECPLDSVVVMTCDLRHADTGEKFLLSDTLTITPCGKDTTLLNRAYGVSDFVLPLKIGEEVDTFLLRFSNEWEMWVVDTLFVKHRNDLHFESVDCPAAMFHQIVDVKWTTHSALEYSVVIDSVAIKRSLVDYNDIENLQIYLRSNP